ncbi:hypothetical protein [Mycobacteroides abscessus]|uniref:hypothetical protein n=1 Tax=Mycobacteroides abscessus TaxID=36809 RepID=UPI00266FA6F5|nr:hypothetical protein [Mycobacteroides abscessus]MDO3110463.1 hypothetical protein [Mycobacteroides abscessus subsp. abscessus]
MSGDEDKTTPDIQVTKATADAGIAAIRGAAPKLVASADSGASLLDEVIKALSVPIGGEGPVEVPTGGADVLRSQGAALETALGSVGDDVQSWVDTEMTIQTDGAKGVEKAGSGGGTFAGATGSGTVDIGVTASGSASVGEIDYSKVK